MAKKFYEEGIRYTKGAFGALLVLMSQWFAPTSIELTLEGDLRAEDIIVRDPKTGNVVELRLPSKHVMMGNHQIYADWLYLWCFNYYARTHKDVLIILKKSLKWVPIVGWGMQFFRFIFLARSWSADRLHLGRSLEREALRAQKSDNSFSLMIFPEGTLVSPNTRPLSKKFADKIGISDLSHVLLPRSTGLLFVLRTLAPSVPSLKLVDMTIAYPGIDPAAYGQEYYTLRSIFMQGIPPPKVHIHLRIFDVARDIPIGDVSKASGIGRGAEASESEREAFDLWLRDRWTEKDRLMAGFYRDGKFTPGKEGANIPLVLRSNLDVLNAFCFFVPVLAIRFGLKAKAWLF